MRDEFRLLLSTVALTGHYFAVQREQGVRSQSRAGECVSTSRTANGPAIWRESGTARESGSRSTFEEVVGASAALRAVLSRVSKVSPTDSTVLLTGETGTGKEVIARAIHKRSRRSSRSFVSVNCAAIPGSLIASELFAMSEEPSRAHCSGT